MLHAPLRTAGGAVIRTPTFHTLSMLSCHRDATRAHSALVRGMPYTLGAGAASVPRLSAVASVDEATGCLHLSVVHVHPHASTTLEVELRGASGGWSIESAEVLTGGSLGACECSPAPLDEEGGEPGAHRALHLVRTASGAPTRLRLKAPPRSLVVVVLSP